MFDYKWTRLPPWLTPILPLPARPLPLGAPQEIYQKKTQLEHILLRPDTYVGSVEKITTPMWVHDGERMVQRSVTYVPGLYKIFDEILVNAADNRARDPTMDTLRVDIDAAAGVIRVFNSGAGIPVEMHAEEKVRPPPRAPRPCREALPPALC